MTPTEEFQNGFRSLRGTTIKERSERLFQLLNHVKEHEAEIDFASIEPQTPLEEVFKVETQIFFRRVDDLLEVLYSENSILIHKVLKVSSWFIKEAFGKISGEELVTKVFPNLSYNTKLKLLNKFSNFLSDQQKCDEYFEAIKKRYGLFLACKMLASCSEDVLLKCMDENKIEITAHQLLTLIKKYPNITETIFLKLENQNYKQGIDEKYKRVFGYLARNHYALFLKLSEKYKPEIKLGSRSSKKVFFTNKASIIKSPKTQTSLKLKKVISWLKEDRFEYFCNSLPKSLNQFQSNYSKNLDFFKMTSPTKAEQLDLLLSCFKKVYDSELWDYSILLTPELFEMMSPDERELWMSCHPKPKEMKEEVWISLMKSEKSVPLLLEKLDATFDSDYRKELTTALVQSCRVNDDVDALFHVFQHVIKKYETVELRLYLINTIGNNFDLTKVTEKHWKYFAKIIPKYLNNYENIWNVNAMFKGYAHYCLEHHMSIPTDLLSKWLKNYSFCDFRWFEKNPQYEKQHLSTIAELIPTVFADEKKIYENYLNYLLSLRDYNKHNKNNRISYFENLEAIKYFKFSDQPWSYIGEWVMEDCLKFEFQKCLEEGLVDIYFNKKPCSNLQKHFLWLMRNHPQTFVNFEPSVINNWYQMTYGLHYFKYAECFKTAPKFFQEYSNYSKFENEPEELNKNAVNFLSHFLEPEIYFNLIALYYPKELIASCDTESEKKIYLLQKVFTRCLRNVMPRDDALKSLMNFCQGDYLKMSHGTMYSISNNIKENKLIDFINILKDRAVSVRKYSIYLAFRLLDKEAVYNFSTNLTKIEKNVSVKKYLLKGNLLYFLRNQDDCFYDLLKENIKGIDSKDTEVYDIITNNVGKVSPKYFKDFFVFIWDILENVDILDDIKFKGMTKLLSAITKKNINLLSEQFCSDLINKYLFKSKDYDIFATKMSEFSSKFMIYYVSDDLEKPIRVVILVLKQNVKSTWCDVEHHLNGRKFVSKLILEFCNDFLSKNCTDCSIVNRLFNMWKQEFEPWEIYNEFLYLKFTCIYCESVSRSCSPSEIGESLGRFCKFLDNTGYSNVNILGDIFETFKMKFVSIDNSRDENESCLLIAENILKLNDSSSGLLLSMLLLLGLNPNLTLKLKEKCETIFNTILSYKDSDVQIYLHQHLLKNT